MTVEVSDRPNTGLDLPVDRTVDGGKNQRASSLDRLTARLTGPQARLVHVACAHQLTLGRPASGSVNRSADRQKPRSRF